jgi:hypothetical protein
MQKTMKLAWDVGDYQVRITIDHRKRNPVPRLIIQERTRKANRHGVWLEDPKQVESLQRAIIEAAIAFHELNGGHHNICLCCKHLYPCDDKDCIKGKDHDGICGHC